MNPPTSMTRFLGTLRVATALYLGCLATIVGSFVGQVPWWLALGALFFVPTVRQAVRNVRRYDEWFAAWQDMGNVRGQATPGQPAQKRGLLPPWVNATLAVLSLTVILIFATSPVANPAVRRTSSLFLVVLTPCFLCKAVVAFRRRRLKVSTNKLSAGDNKTNTTREVVRWMLPRALRSPSRADAMRNLPDYCARLMAPQ
jgi:hypothetical protein